MEYKCYYCGRDANYQLKNGKWCCMPSYNQCPELRRKNAEKIKSMYSKNENGDIIFNGKLRKNDYTEESRKKQGWAKGKNKFNDIRIRKQSETLLKKYKNGELKSPFFGKHHTEETKKKLSKCGGYRKCGSRGKQGWYQGYWCDSSWELAYVIYNLEHNIKFLRNNEGFEYEYENKKYKYYPDFILEDGTYVEIKGYLDKKNKAKIESFKNKLIIIDGKTIKEYLNYVIEKYGKNFIELYKDYKHVETKIPCPQCGNLMLKKSKLCKKCTSLKLKVSSIKPDKDTLIDKLIKTNLTEVSKFYNVSHTTIKRWYEEYNIDYEKIKEEKRINKIKEKEKIKQEHKRKFITITYNNKTQTISEWAKELNILPCTIKSRYNKGKSVEEILKIK